VLDKTLTIGLTLPFGLISCGGDDKKDSGGSTATPEKKADSYDSLSDEMLSVMNSLADALGSVKDKATAEAAAKKIDGLVPQVNDIAARLKKLGKPSKEQAQKINAKMDAADAKFEEKMKVGMGAAMSDPEVGKVIMTAMNDFGEKTKEMDKLVQDYFESQGDDATK